MKKTQTAKLFTNGSSQAVRLPAEFHFSGKEVYVTLDDATGDVVLSRRPGANIWKDFFDLIHSIDASMDFMNGRPMNMPAQDEGVFDDVLHNMD